MCNMQSENSSTPPPLHEGLGPLGCKTTIFPRWKLALHDITPSWSVGKSTLEPYEYAKNNDDVMNNPIDSKHISDGSTYTTNVHVCVHVMKNIVEELKNIVEKSKNMKVESNNMKNDLKNNMEGVKTVDLPSDMEKEPLIPTTCSFA